MKSLGIYTRYAVAFCVGAMLFAETSLAQVETKTNGNMFSRVSGKATLQPMNEHLVIQSDQGQIVRIRGVVILPKGSKSSQRLDVGKIAVNFKSKNLGGALRSVELCESSNCKKLFNGNLRGDFSTSSAFRPSRNVISVSPPASVSSNSYLLLEVVFPQIIDEGSIPPEDLRFTLFSVNTTFPGIFATSPVPLQAKPIKTPIKGSFEGVPVQQVTVEPKCADGPGGLIGELAGGALRVTSNGLLLFYDSQDGSARVYQQDAVTKAHLLRCYSKGSFTPHWTHITAISSGIFFYNTGDGSAAFGTLDPSGVFTTLKSYSAHSFTGRWSNIVGTPTGVLFYDRDQGSAVIGRFDELGNFANVRAYAAGLFAKGWTSIEYNDGLLHFTNANTGATSQGEIDSSGSYSSK